MQLHNLLAKTVDAFQISGNATRKTIVVMDLMKETFVPRKLVLTSNSHAQGLAIVFHNRGCAVRPESFP